jgi:hypothetical protein
MADPAISSLSAVMGAVIDIGRAARGASGFVLLDAVAAPAGAKPIASEANSTTPPPMAPNDVRLKRFKVILPSNLMSQKVSHEEERPDANFMRNFLPKFSGFIQPLCT